MSACVDIALHVPCRLGTPERSSSISRRAGIPVSSASSISLPVPYAPYFDAQDNLEEASIAQIRRDEPQQHENATFQHMSHRAQIQLENIFAGLEMISQANDSKRSEESASRHRGLTEESGNESNTIHAEVGILPACRRFFLSMPSLAESILPDSSFGTPENMGRREGDFKEVHEEIRVFNAPQSAGEIVQPDDAISMHDFPRVSLTPRPIETTSTSIHRIPDQERTDLQLYTPLRHWSPPPAYSFETDVARRRAGDDTPFTQVHSHLCFETPNTMRVCDISALSTRSEAVVSILRNVAVLGSC